MRNRVGFTQKELAKWRKALTSGRYKQSRGRLYTRGSGYCCLGVDCRVNFGTKLSQFKSAGTPDYVGIARWTGSKLASVQDRLIDLNDAYEVPFELIAWCLEGWDGKTYDENP